MFSLERCRAIIRSGCSLDEKRLTQLRDQLYGLANVGVEELCRQRKNGQGHERDDSSPGEFRAAISLLIESEREDVEERAAIIEFEGGADRDEAERKAILGSLQTRCEKKGRN
jgi:hypothetical protein